VSSDWRRPKLAPRNSGGAFNAHLCHVVLQHFGPADMVVRLRQEADAVLQIDRTHALEPAP
jgi:hypothetical protein